MAFVHRSFRSNKLYIHTTQPVLPRFGSVWYIMLTQTHLITEFSNHVIKWCLSIQGFCVYLIFSSLYTQKWNCSAIWQLLSFLRNCQTAFQIPHILAKKSLSSVLFHYNHSVGVKLYQSEALLCMTLMTNDFDHFSGIYCPISISPLGGKWLRGSVPIVLLFFWETVSGSQGWPCTLNPPTSTMQIMKLQTSALYLAGHYSLLLRFINYLCGPKVRALLDIYCLCLSPIVIYQFPLLKHQSYHRFLMPSCFHLSLLLCCLCLAQAQEWIFFYPPLVLFSYI